MVGKVMGHPITSSSHKRARIKIEVQNKEKNISNEKTNRRIRGLGRLEHLDKRETVPLYNYVTGIELEGFFHSIQARASFFGRSVRRRGALLSAGEYHISIMVTKDDSPTPESIADRGTNEVELKITKHGRSPNVTVANQPG